MTGCDSLATSFAPFMTSSDCETLPALSAVPVTLIVQAMDVGMSWEPENVVVITTEALTAGLVELLASGRTIGLTWATGAARCSLGAAMPGNGAATPAACPKPDSPAGTASAMTAVMTRATIVQVPSALLSERGIGARTTFMA